MTTELITERAADGVLEPTGAGRRCPPVGPLHLRRRARGTSAETGHVVLEHRE